jgi:hypothetical protein
MIAPSGPNGVGVIVAGRKGVGVRVANSSRAAIGAYDRTLKYKMEHNTTIPSDPARRIYRN